MRPVGLCLVENYRNVVEQDEPFPSLTLTCYSAILFYLLSDITFRYIQIAQFQISHSETTIRSPSVI